MNNAPTATNQEDPMTTIETVALNQASQVFKTRKGAENEAARLATPDLTAWWEGERISFEVGTVLGGGYAVLARTEREVQA